MLGMFALGARSITMRQEMKILLTGVSGFRNRGVEALVDTAQTEISATRPNASFTIVTTDPTYDVTRNAPEVTVLRDSPTFFKQSRLRRSLIRALVPKRRLPSVQRIQQAIDEADVVIASGGDIFSSDYGIGLLRRQAALLEEAQRAGRKTVFLAHSIGPFKTAAEVAILKPVLEASSLITVRESLTQRYLVDDVGIAKDRVVLTSDVAFLLQPSEPRRMECILSLAGVPADVPYVALAPSEGITSFSDIKNRGDHDAAWIDTVRHFLSTEDLHVLLIPHVQEVNIANDDSQIAFRLMERLGFPKRLHSAMGPLSARDFKGLIAGAQFFAGERMHACIAALSMLVPSLVIGYSVKARGIMNDIFDGHSQARTTISVADFVGAPARSRMLTEVWDQKEEIRQVLGERIPLIKQRAARNFEALSPVIGVA
jgi:colanic acid/amylovoran biosynthesis protein